MKSRQVDVTSVTKQPVLLKAMNQDTVIKRQWMGMKQQVGGGKRSKITKLTRASLRRMKLQFRNMPDATHMITLTYPGYVYLKEGRFPMFPTDGREVKRHFTAIKKWLIRHGVTAGAWFLEFQKRGAPHFHMFVNGSVPAHELAYAWIRIVQPTSMKFDPTPELMAVIQRAQRWHVGGLLVGKDKQGNVCTNRPCIEPIRVKHAVSAYATAYASKADQKRVPSDYQNVGRFWGVWGDYRHKDVSEHGLSDVEFSVDESDCPQLWAAAQTVRAVRGLLKSRGHKVKDDGRYGYVAWGVGNDIIKKLMDYYVSQYEQLC